MRSLARVFVVVAGAVAGGCGGGYVDEYYEDVGAVTVEVSAPAAEEDGPAVVSTKRSAAGDGWNPAEFVKSVPANPRGAANGLEKHREWQALDWANPAQVSAWKRHASGDDVVLVVNLKGGGKDKAAVLRAAEIAVEKNGRFALDVFNPTDREINVAFAVFAGLEDVYSESIAKPAAAGWSHLEWDLAAKTFKSEASGWKNSTALWGTDQVKRLVLLFYDSGKATLVIDDIQVDLAPRTK
jgi:hypothetical protein